MGDVARRHTIDDVDDERVDRGRRGPEHALGVAGQQDAVDTEREPDAVGGRSAEVLGEPVVATTAPDRVLGGVERRGGELEGGAAVVVQPAHQQGRLDVLDAHGIEPADHPFEVRRGRVGQERGDAGSVLDHCPVTRPFGIEDPQRIAVQGALGGLAQLAAPRVQVRTDRIAVAGTVTVVTQGVHRQLDLAQTQCLEETGRERDDLDVQVGVIDAEHLDTDLVEHAVAALLCTLVTEVGPGVPDLPGKGRAMLHERADDARGDLGTQCDAGAVLVDEVVHLLGDHVGGLADAQEHAQVLQQRRHHLAVPRGAAAAANRCTSARRRDESGSITSCMPLRVRNSVAGAAEAGSVTSGHATGASASARNPLRRRPGGCPGTHPPPLRLLLSGRTAQRPERCMKARTWVNRSSSCQW